MALLIEFRENIECTLKSRNDFDKLLTELSERKIDDKKDLKIEFDLDKYDGEVIKEMVDLSKKLPKQFSTFFVIQNKGSKIRCSDLLNFVNLEDSLNKEDIGLYFNGGLDLYNLNEVITAQEQIEDFTDKLKDLDASPLEKYLIIYNFLISKVYKENELNSAKSRDVIAVLNGDNIVCVGYAVMLERLCNEVGIDCYEQSCSVYSKKDDEYRGGHANNIVRIKDDKYGIDGAFYADACWDSVNKGKEHKKTYSYCLLPLQDKNNMKKAKVDVGNDSKFLYNTDVESVLCMSFSNKFENFGINKHDKTEFNFDEVEDEQKQLFMNEEKRVLACDRLEKILKDNEIPANLYVNKKFIPEICSLERMLALCMEDNVDQKRLNEAIRVINKLKDNGEESSLKDRGFKSVNGFSKVEDLYKKIADLKNLKNIREDTQISWKDGYTFGEVLKALQSNDKQALEQMEFKRIKLSVNNLPHQWEEIVKSYIDIIRERETKKEIMDFIGTSDVISIEVFEKALRRSYELEGMSPNSIEYETRRAIADTISNSEAKFKTSSLNCFTQEALKYRNAENEL